MGKLAHKKTKEDLNAAERAFAERLFALGSRAFDGVSEAERVGVITDPRVRDYLEALGVEYASQDAARSRAAFIASRGLLQLLPKSVQVIADSLEGPEYLRDEETGAVVFDFRGNPLVKNMPPTNGQREAAYAVMDRMGMMPKAAGASPPQPVSISVLLQQAETVVHVDYPTDATPQEKVMSRERIRAAMEELMGLVPAGQKKLKKVLASPGKIKKMSKALSEAKTATGPPPVVEGPVFDPPPSTNGEGNKDAT